MLGVLRPALAVSPGPGRIPPPSIIPDSTWKARIPTRDAFSIDFRRGELLTTKGTLAPDVARWLRDTLLVPGEDSVTVETRITHFALATPGEVRAVATYLGGQDRRHFFRVHVFDNAGLIAEADHTRAVVLPKRLRAIARHRAGLPAMLLDV